MQLRKKSPIQPTRRVVMGGIIAVGVASYTKAEASAIDATTLGFPGHSDTDARRILASCIQRADKIYLPAGQFFLDGSLSILRSGVEIISEKGTELVCTAKLQPAFIIGNRETEVNNPRFVNIGLSYSGQRVRIQSKATGYDTEFDPAGFGIPLRNWQSGVVHLNGGGLQIDRGKFSNFDVGILVRGNVADKNELKNGFSLSSVDISQCDFGILCQQFKNARITGLHGRNTSNVHGVLPHILYVTDRSAKMSDGLELQDISDAGNLFSSSIKFRNVQNVNGGRIRVVDSSGFIDFGRCTKASLCNISFVHSNRGRPFLRSCFDIRDSSEIRVENSTVSVGENQIAVRIYDDGSPTISRNIEFVDVDFDLDDVRRVPAFLSVEEGRGIRFVRCRAKISGTRVDCFSRISTVSGEVDLSGLDAAIDQSSRQNSFEGTCGKGVRRNQSSR